jgi:serine/threonine-protein kinase
MAYENWQKVREVFDAALRQEPADRQNYLNEACGDDKALLTEVESLFSSLAKSDEFLETPAVAHVADIIESQKKPLALGTRFGHYELIRQIGIGGMGEVFLASDTGLERRVALKFLPAHFSQDKVHLRRFQQEARAVAALSHPNVCTIHEVFETAEGRHCIVMEYVEGVTLRTRMRGRRLSLAAAIDIALQIAGALSAAHDAGIVHRDIKPENVVVRPDGLVKVLDFGIAKYAGPARGRDAKHSWIKTATGVVIGTTAYMSPEQARGKGVDARTDVWSLGVILYEMVARRLPFPGKTPTDRVAAILEREPESLSRLRLGVPAELERIISRTLAKDRDDRYLRAADLAEDLRKLRVTLGAEPPFRFALPSSARGLLFSRKRRAVALATLLLIITAALVAGLSYLYFRQNPTPAPQTEIRSLAVLPLENLSGDPAQEYFADGMTDALIGDLAKIGALRVISRTSTMHYKGTKKSLPEIAQELQVEAVVEGTVQRSDGRVRIRAQLIHAATERHLWVETYERDERNVLDLQSEVARAIASEIKVAITPQEQARLARVRQVNRTAYNDYLLGIYHWNQRTEEHVLKAIDYFQSAIREDETYAPAYAGLADCYNILAGNSYLDPRECYPRAKDYATKAIELDGTLAEAHIALGIVRNHYDGDRAGGEQELKRAIELDAGNSTAHTRYALVLAEEGRIEESLAESRRAVELDPVSLIVNTGFGQRLYNARRFDEAIDQLSKTLELDPNFYPARLELGQVYAQTGRYAESLAELNKAAELFRDSTLAALGYVYAISGRRSEARQVLAELERLSRRRYVSSVGVAAIHAGLGEKNQAFIRLDKAFGEREARLLLLRVEPKFDSLRSDPRFDGLLRRLGLAQ